MKFHAQLSTDVVNVNKSSSLALVTKMLTYASVQLVAEQTSVLCHHAIFMSSYLNILFLALRVGIQVGIQVGIYKVV